jgi:hypothetical protein
MQKVFEIASNISTPLALGGFVSAILFLILRQILRLGIFSAVSGPQTSRVILVVVNRLFVLSIIAVILGFLGYVTNLILTNWSTIRPVGKLTQREIAPSRIYLNRIIDPPGAEGAPTLTTVYLGSTGPQDYYVDSITITHHRGQFTSIGSGAQIPDANYSFSFAFGSSETHPLNPALRLDSADREVSFTLGLAPTGFFPSVGGFVTALLHYHTNDGRQGTLLVSEPNEAGQRLAGLLSRDIRVVSSVLVETITPDGRQRGSEVVNDSALLFQRIPDPEAFWSYSKHDNRQPMIRGVEDRAALNQEILKQQKSATIADWVTQKGQLGFDLCKALITADCEASLYGTLPDERAISAIAVRHLISPSDRLPEYVLDHPALQWGFEARELAAALSLRRSGPWLPAILQLGDREPDVFGSLNDIYDSLAAQDIQQVERSCITLIARGGYILDPLRFLIKGQRPLEEIEALLLKAPSSPSQDNEGATRASWAAELIGTAAVARLLNFQPIDKYSILEKFLPEQHVIGLPDLKATDLGGVDKDDSLDPNQAAMRKAYEPGVYWAGLATYIDQQQKGAGLVDVSGKLTYAALPLIYIMGSSASQAFEAPLMSSLTDRIKGDWALQAISRRHLSEPTSTLAEALIRHVAVSSTGEYSVVYAGGVQAAVGALRLAPVGRWDTALLQAAFAPEGPRLAWSASLSLWNKMPAQTRSLFVERSLAIIQAKAVQQNLSEAIRLALLNGVSKVVLRKEVRRLRTTITDQDRQWMEANELYHSENLLGLSH